MNRTRYAKPLGEKTFRAAVRRWFSPGYVIDECKLQNGKHRIDQLCVPLNWNHRFALRLSKGCPLLGIEIKTSRSDFLAGLRRDQFNEYDGQVAALYIATAKGDVKTGEIPKGIGHLVVSIKQGSNPVAVCRRRPLIDESFVPSSEYSFWLMNKLLSVEQEHRRNLDREYQKKLDRLGSKFGKVFGKFMNSLEEIQ